MESAGKVESTNLGHRPIASIVGELLVMASGDRDLSQKSQVSNTSNDTAPMRTHHMWARPVIRHAIAIARPRRDLLRRRAPRELHAIVRRGRS